MTKPAPFIIVALLTFIAAGVLYMTMSTASANQRDHDRAVRECTLAHYETGDIQQCIGR